MKVGIFGGTFDPIHLGHIAIAKAAKEQFGLDMVRIMPARIPPHKQTKAVTEDVHRLMMISLALPVGEGIELDLTEFEREGVSYTSDTLTLLHERHPGDELYYIIGEDSPLHVLLEGAESVALQSDQKKTSGEVQQEVGVTVIDDTNRVAGAVVIANNSIPMISDNLSYDNVFQRVFLR